MYSFIHEWLADKHHFNWFFVTRDPFYLLPARVAPFIMPVLNITVFFAADMLIYLLFFVYKKASVSAKTGL